MDKWDNMPPLEDGGDNEQLRGESDISIETNVTGITSITKHNKKRLWAGIAAAFLIVVMVTVGAVFGDRYFFGPSKPADGGGDFPPGGDTEVHQNDPSLPFAPRNARSAFMPKDLALEINIGGSGEDILGDVLELNGIFYLFGSTTSTDYDFKGHDSGDLFMCTMNTNGRLLTATTFGTPYKDTFIKARFNEQGFYILSMTSAIRPAATVFHVGWDGALKDAYTFNTAKTVEPKDMYVDRNMIYVCCEAVNQITQFRSPLFFALNNNLEPQWLQQPDETDYEFVAMFPAASGFVALFNGDIGGQKYPVLCRFTKLAKTEFVPLKQRASGNKIFASDMIPAADGAFLIFISDEADESAGGVIKVSKELKQIRSASADIKQCGGGKLFYISGNVYLAVASYVGNARGRMLVDGASELSTIPINGLDNIGEPREHVVNTGNTLLLSTTEILTRENIMLTVMSPSFTRQFQNTYGGTGADKAVAFYTVSDGVIIFGHTDSKDVDVGGNFGRSDIWVFKVRDR